MTPEIYLLYIMVLKFGMKPQEIANKCTSSQRVQVQGPYGSFHWGIESEAFDNFMWSILLSHNWRPTSGPDFCASRMRYFLGKYGKVKIPWLLRTKIKIIDFAKWILRY